MNGVSGYNSALKGYTGPGTTWANGMNFGMNNIQGPGSITQPVDLQSGMLPLCYSCSLIISEFTSHTNISAPVAHIVVILLL